MHAEKTVRAAGGAGQRSDRDRRSIRGQNGRRAQNTVRRGEHFPLDFDLLGNGLNRKIGARDCGEVGNELNAAEDLRLIGLEMMPAA